MVKKAIALGLMLTVTSVASAQFAGDVPTKNITKQFKKSGLNFNFGNNLENEAKIVGKVTPANQDLDEDSDGEGVKAPSRVSIFFENAKEKVSGFFSWIASKFGF